ncbi:diguanylate cyclase [Desulfuribacillus stibiiarsenatis]|uniref:Diguanylate cyclase n=1 Tax=Desulfuribacillus stibiiarsenatis TaxID=1390249 RepID=A0A1E5L554_9FIRM|nr:sensor domain-containing diguanylate cyclase [Desulfuribacillus stibiiarsenatis]OEH85265.1 diguanylate cyclase [Desulfuribacillus stibiiarsenatis]
MHFSFSLRTRFAFTLAFLIIVLSIFMSFFTGQFASQEVRSEIGNSLAEVSYLMGDKLDHYMWARSGEILILSKLETLQEARNLKAIQALLDQLKSTFPSFAWIGFTDPNGIVLASTDAILEGADISKRPVYLEALKGHFVGDVHEAVLLAKLLPNPSGEAMKFVDVSTPVYNENGDLVGVLAAHLSWEWAREVEESILVPLQNRKQLEMYIVSSMDDTLLLGPRDIMGQPLKLDSINRARSGENTWSLETWPDGKEYLTGFSFGKGYKDYPGLGWTVLVRQPAEVAYASVEKLQKVILYIGLFVALLFATFGLYIARRVVEPLRQITLAANSLSAGKQVEIPQHKGITDIEILSESLRNLIRSLTQTEKALGKMEILAQHDQLTGLPNRISLDYHLEKAKAQVERQQSSLTFLYLDLDGFKAVNDTLGHHTGDVLLQEVANRLKQHTREDDLVARLGGDEFVMILSSPTEKAISVGEDIAERVIASLNDPFIIDGNEIIIGCSIGGAVWPADAEETKDVIRLADEALYIVKRSGKNRVVFINHK